MKVRIKFNKFGPVKFIGHLDMMRYFQKAVRRAGIDIAYSGGFSPHQIMSFASPLGVGIESEGEYLDIEVHSLPSPEAAKEALGREMVNGITILDLKILPDETKNAMACVTRAAYFLKQKEGLLFPLPFDELSARAEAFMEADQILITKKTKRKEAVVDIRPMIYQFQAMKRNGRPGIYMEISSGSSMNLKPGLAAEAFYEFMGFSLEPNELQTLRIDLYMDTEAGIRTLL